MKTTTHCVRPAAVKRPRALEEISSLHDVADRQLIHHGYRHPVTQQLLTATMPLVETFNEFDDSGVVDLSTWHEAQLATVPALFYRSFPADGGLAIRIASDIRQLPAPLLERPIASLVFVDGPRNGENASMSARSRMPPAWPHPNGMTASRQDIAS